MAKLDYWNDPDAGRRKRRRWADAALVGVALAGLITAAAAAAIYSKRFDDEDLNRAAYDQNHFHLDAIVQFAIAWPRVDLSDYPSATTPGYHLVMAAVARGRNVDLPTLRLIGLTFTLGLVLTLALALARHVRPVTAFALALPLVCSLYVFSSAAWLLPDNAGWWGLLAVLLVALRPRWGPRSYVLGGTLLALLVFVRQVNLWAAAVLCLAAWTGSEPSGAPGAPGAPGEPPEPWQPRLRRFALAAFACLPAVLIVAYFVALWGGPTPPTFRTGGPEAATGHQGVNPAVPAFTLALLAGFGVFFLGFVLPAAWPVLKRNAAPRLLVLGALAAGLLVGVLPETSESFPARRSGLWKVAGVLDAKGILPTVADRSPLIVVMSAAGAALLALWFLALGRRDRWIFLAAWLLFMLAQTANAMAWQRYYEPFVLMMLALMSARAAAATDPVRRPRWASAGPVALAVLLAAVTVVMLHGGFG